MYDKGATCHYYIRYAGQLGDEAAITIFENRTYLQTACKRSFVRYTYRMSIEIFQLCLLVEGDKIGKKRRMRCVLGTSRSK